ncbi:hypothetical protein AVEN_195806-1 [Araneus ventricosus]|uniref:Uncharacterized protein n=1 Tax=Araneus ventricosus TaxID=182803 RepID=A0A4Y2GJS5_ARAVE|nr:hypothetical protein AVEN_195806-1 [Araneus ventricosus]
MQHKASGHSRTEHSTPLDALFAHNARFRQSGHSRCLDRCPELHERIPQVPRKAAEQLSDIGIHTRARCGHKKGGPEEMTLIATLSKRLEQNQRTILAESSTSLPRRLGSLSIELCGTRPPW